MTSIDEKGKRYGRLLVLHKASADGRKGTRWVCRCDCGTQTIVRRGTELRRGDTRSCGCLHSDIIRTAFLKRSRGNALDRFDEDIL
jgi:hypothetical protein